MIDETVFSVLKLQHSILAKAIVINKEHMTQ